MKMKKLSIGILSCLMGLGGLCSTNAAEFFRLATIGPGSSSFMVMSTFAQIVSRKLPDGEIQVHATGTATQHAIEAAKGRLDFFMLSASVHDSMSKGVNMFRNIPDAPELSKNLRAIFAFPLGLYHITTFADSGISKLEDIKGKKVFLGPAGGGATAIMEKVLEAATGYKAGEDYDALKLGWDAAAQAFHDGRIDVYINPTNAPSSVIQQMALSREIRFLGLTKEQIQKPAVKAILGRPGGVLGQIEPGIYGTHQVNTEVVQTPGSIVGIGAGKHLADEDVYKITKAFWEGFEEASAKMPWLRRLSLKNAFQDLNLPLHPGAARYYQEIGMNIPPDLMAAE